MSIEKNKAAAKRWHQAWGTSGITAAYAEYLAPEFRAMFFGQGWVDRATYIERDQAFMAAFEGIQLTVEEIIGEGDLVFCRMRWRARHIGPIFGIQATGRRFEIMGFGQDRFRAGQVVEHIPLFDQASFIQQIQRP
jgi:predicted ester cyclase